MENKILVNSLQFDHVATFDGLPFSLKLHKTGTKTEEIIIKSEGMYFFLQSGQAEIIQKNCHVNMTSGMYFSLNSDAQVVLSQNSCGISIKIKKDMCLNTFGGPVESTGRLKYIDGCSDTLLLSPAKLGLPCLNLLHFPANTKQTAHHHPSFRFGIVFSGSGQCVTEGRVDKLTTGDIFYIPAYLKHKFDTTHESMNVIAFHPDSDWGPTDEIHPMINRTII